MASEMAGDDLDSGSESRLRTDCEPSHELCLAEARQPLEEKATRDIDSEDSISYVSRLPAEILAHIFQMFQILQYRHRAWGSYKRRTFSECVIPLLPLTHVCQYWREVALGTSMLWSIIDIYPDDPPIKDPNGLLHEILRRSRDVDLEISLWSVASSEVGEPVWKAVKQECLRITSLVLVLEDYIAQDLGRRISGPGGLPRLRKLRLCVRPNGGRIGGDADRHLVIRSMQQLVATSRLTDLTPSGSLDLLHPLFQPSLTQLSLGGVEFPVNSDYVSITLSILATLPSLRVLQFSRYSSLHVYSDGLPLPWSTQPSAVLHLPRLQELKMELCDNPNIANGIIRALPPPERVTIVCQPQHRGYPVQALRETRGDPTLLQICFGDGFNFVCWISSSRCSPNQVHTSITGTNEDWNSHYNLRFLHQLIQGPVVQEIYIRSETRRVPFNLAATPNIKRLHMCNGWLFLGLEEHKDDYIPLPAMLEVLVLEDMSFASSMGEYSDPNSLYRRLYAGLRVLMSTRGHPLDRLELGTCQNIDETGVDGLRGVVMEVMWDGLVKEEDSKYSYMLETWSGDPAAWGLGLEELNL